MTELIDIWDTVTNVYWWNKSTDKPLVVNQGGTYSGKTIAILQVLIDKGLEEPGARITITTQDFPKLYDDPLKEFKLLISSEKVKPFFVDVSLNRGVYRMHNGSAFTFRCFDDVSKATGSKRDYLYVNEAWGTPFEIFFELWMRTEKQVFIDYNPSKEFWSHQELMHREDCQVFISTFMDNPYCSDKKKKEIFDYYLKYQLSKSEYWLNKWRVYGQGKTGIISGVVFPNIRRISNFPDPYYLRTNKDGLSHIYGLDFGYMSDPTAIGKMGIRAADQRIVSEEIFYQTGYNAFDLPELFPKLGIRKGIDVVVADSANMEAIDLLVRHGYVMVAAKKDPGSVKAGIDLINKHGLDITINSENALKEQRNYVYRKTHGRYDKDLPVDKDNHFFDQLRYAATYFIHGWGEIRGKVRQIYKPRKAIVI
jgi:phage terminase large subunit